MDPDEGSDAIPDRDNEVSRRESLRRWPLAMQQAKTRKPQPAPKAASGLSDAAVVGLLGDRYQNIEPVADRRGTFTAEDKRMGRRVLLKVRRLAADHHLRNQPFGDVVKLLQSIPARYRCDVLDYVESDHDAGVLIMERIDGVSLGELIDKGYTAIPAEDLRRWMCQVCEALTILAACGIVHRNLKPSNIVIGSDSIARVIEFSSMAIAGSDNDLGGFTVGYVAPERLDGTPPASSQFDIYGFGATFYRACTGRVLRTSLAEGRLGGTPDQIEMLTRLKETLPESLAEMLVRCLEPNPERRMQSFVEIRSQLELRQPTTSPYEPPLKSPEVPGCVVLNELGRGGMGVVYRALDLQTNDEVAIKFIRAFGGGELQLLARFRIEAEAFALLRHPNIVPVVRMGIAMGFPYIVLEYVGGGSLANHMSQGALNPTHAARIAEGVARGLAHSHNLSILHRDLKPQNVMLSVDGVPRITDFGLAKITAMGQARKRLRSASIMPVIDGSLMELMRFRGLGEEQSREALRRQVDETVELVWQECGPSVPSVTTRQDVENFLMETLNQPFDYADNSFGQPVENLTHEGQLLGTPKYMAPEQTDGDSSRIGRHTDIYALGVILFEMLTGSVPFTASRLTDLFKQIRFAPTPAMSIEVPASLRKICETCLAKDLEARYPDAEALADDLRQFLDSDEAKMDCESKAEGKSSWANVGKAIRKTMLFKYGR